MKPYPFTPTKGCTDFALLQNKSKGRVPIKQGEIKEWRRVQVPAKVPRFATPVRGLSPNNPPDEKISRQLYTNVRIWIIATQPIERY